MALLEVKFSQILAADKTAIVARFYRLDPEGASGTGPDGRAERRPLRELLGERRIDASPRLARAEIAAAVNALLPVVAAERHMGTRDEDYVRAR